ESARADQAQVLMHCRGPHVGSYRNKVFKRYMYATEIPLIIFVTEDKIDCPIEVGKCHFVLDRELTWTDFIERHPVAFIVGCSQKRKTELVGKFRTLGLEITGGTGYSSTTAFAARNKAFIEKFEIPTKIRPHEAHR